MNALNISGENLKPEEYQAIIGPALHAAADTAAARGDPDLYNDIASMLTLMTLVRDLGDLYQHQWGALGQISSPALFAAAPQAACVIVLQEQELGDDAIVMMVEALNRAEQMVRDDNLLGQERVEVQKAWDAHLEKNTELAHAHLKQAAKLCVALIDKWEFSRQLAE